MGNIYEYMEIQLIDDGWLMVNKGLYYPLYNFVLGLGLEMTIHGNSVLNRPGLTRVLNTVHLFLIFGKGGKPAWLDLINYIAGVRNSVYGGKRSMTSSMSTYHGTAEQ